MNILYIYKDYNMEYATPDYSFRIPNTSPVTKVLI